MNSNEGETVRFLPRCFVLSVGEKPVARPVAVWPASPSRRLVGNQAHGQCRDVGDEKEHTNHQQQHGQGCHGKVGNLGLGNAALETKRLTPTGGVTKPMARFTTMMMPK